MCHLYWLQNMTVSEKKEKQKQKQNKKKRSCFIQKKEKYWKFDKRQHNLNSSFHVIGELFMWKKMHNRKSKVHNINVLGKSIMCILPFNIQN